MECEPGTTQVARARGDRGGRRQGPAPAAGRRAPARRWTSTWSTTSCAGPSAERFSILLAEFGTGLAGRGEELNEVIHRANPALRETDRVLAILAQQNRVLADLARDSDAVARPARARAGGGDRLHRAGQRAPGRPPPSGAPTSRRGIQRLPGFLRELRPLMADLGGFAGQAAPVARDLNRVGRRREPDDPGAGPVLDRVHGPPSTQPRRGPRDRAARAAARAAAGPGPAAASPPKARPLSRDLDELTKSLDETGGIERADGLPLLLDDSRQRLRRASATTCARR